MLPILQTTIKYSKCWGLTVLWSIKRPLGHVACQVRSEYREQQTISNVIVKTVWGDDNFNSSTPLLPHKRSFLGQNPSTASKTMDKLKDMEISPILCHFSWNAIIFKNPLRPSGCRDFKFQGIRWKILTMSYHRYNIWLTVVSGFGGQRLGTENRFLKLFVQNTLIWKGSNRDA